MRYDELLRYEFFLRTGMREQEVIYATDRAVDFVNCTVSVQHHAEYNWSPKMYKERTIDVPKALAEKLKKMLVKRGKGGLLFQTANGLPKFDFLNGAKAIGRRELTRTRFTSTNSAARSARAHCGQALTSPWCRNGWVTMM